MKKLIFIIALIFFLSLNMFAQLVTPADTVGTLITASIRPNSQQDDIATAYTNEIRGGLHNLETWEELLNIKSSRLVPNMFATVADSAGKLYQYDGVSWNEFSSGAELPDWLFEGQTLKHIEAGNGRTAKGIRFEDYSSEYFLGDVYDLKGFSTQFFKYDKQSNQTFSFDFKNWQSDNVIMTMDNENAILIWGDPFFKGIIYGSDFSANFTNESLINKGFADENYQNTWQQTIDNMGGSDLYVNFPNGGFEDNGYGDITHYADRSLVLRGADSWLIINDNNDSTIKLGAKKGLVYHSNIADNLTDRTLIDKGYADSIYQPKKADTTYTDVLNISHEQNPNYATISHDGLWFNINTGNKLSIASNIANNYYRINGSSTTIRATESVLLGIDETDIVSLNSWGTGLVYDFNYELTNPNGRTLIDRDYADSRYLRAEVLKIAGNGITKFWGLIARESHYTPAYPFVTVYRKSDSKMLVNGTDYNIEAYTYNQFNVDMTVAPAAGDTIVFTIITP
ncbi:hypothetical protein [Lentimicrobium sp. S6]|uniref:hypothetical protein n=1 Tax=Lentimicrobium sp. S6 TaxID=2735872 RepID=UPI0015531597|nr:hypothetical protein [Lentimicrobium sp. S6]NPD47496.1 hypothetical protein [Lentimicrobium sp. S6]